MERTSADIYLFRIIIIIVVETITDLVFWLHTFLHQGSLFSNIYTIFSIIKIDIMASFKFLFNDKRNLGMSLFRLIFHTVLKDKHNNTTHNKFKNQFEMTASWFLLQEIYDIYRSWRKLLIYISLNEYSTFKSWLSFSLKQSPNICKKIRINKVIVFWYNVNSMRKELILITPF